MRLPWFFSNLLPEGTLRELIAKREGIHPEREFFLIARLGDDLPGAIVVVPKGPLMPGTGDVLAPQRFTDEESPLRFSLAGIQLKFSVLREDRGLTIPLSGSGGDWIAKLPDGRFDHVPLNEFSMMTWAQAAGIEVPQFELRKVTEIQGLPSELSFKEPDSYVIRRFDRDIGGRRIHIEDFGQVLGIHPGPREKYEKANYETLARILFRLAGSQALDEFVRRLVFNAAIGNSDAHLKNWSLIYPDGVQAKLSPAYDLVSTIQYLPGGLALNLAKSKLFEKVSLDSFGYLAEKIPTDPAWIKKLARDSVQRTRQAWQLTRAAMPIPEEFKRKIEAHWTSIPLMNER
jgi:serine/threonine-protein kinase HipA